MHRETKFDGLKAKIIAVPHPHYNEDAICMGADLTNAGWGMKFKNINTNEEFYVFDGKEIEWLNYQK